MKKKRNLLILSLFIAFLSISVIWIMNLHVTEGYVYEVQDRGLFVIELDDLDEFETNTMDEGELDKVLAQKVSEEKGDIYKVPFLNELMRNDFNKADKVRIYWDGTMTASIPGLVDGTTLIIKLSK